MNDETSLEEALELFYKFDDSEPITEYTFTVSKSYNFYQKLEKLTKKNLVYEAGDLVQDAQFHSQIQLDTNQHWLCFSSWGNLISVYGDEDVDSEMINTVKTLAKEFGYIYIPGGYIQLPYDGVFKNTTTWDQRYFSW